MGDIILDAAYFAAVPLVAIEWQNIIDIIVGSGQLLLGALESLQFVPDMIDVSITLFEFSLSHLICGMKLLANWKQCVLYYILDAIGQLLYLPVRITLWALFTFLRLDLYKAECKFWGALDLFDRWWFTKTSFHLIHYPKNIRDDCYNCCRVKTEVLMDKGNKLNDDLMTVIPTLVWPGITNIVNGVSNFMNPF